MTYRFPQALGILGLFTLLATYDARVRVAYAAEKPPITGKAVPRLRQIDQVMLEIVREYNLPGASLAIAKNGRLVFAHGYGWADRENKKPVRPESRFNIASCTKPITAAAVLKLVDQGKLRLDDKAFDLLSGLKPPADAKIDPHPRDHYSPIAASCQRSGSGSWPLPQIARRLHVEPPLDLSQVVAFNLGRPMQFNPGSEAKYSNLGFLVLRLVIERGSGQGYEKFTSEQVLKPMGISEAHLDLLAGYLPREVHRYPPGGKTHGGGHGELKGGGCWVLSPTDAMRFLTSLDGSRRERVLSERAYRQMLEPLPSLGVKRNGRHNGLGWDIVEHSGAGVLHSKNGGVAGIATWIEHMPNGVCWAAFFNGSLKDTKSDDEAEQTRKAAAKSPWPQIRQAIQRIEVWPTHDLFTSE